MSRWVRAGVLAAGVFAAGAAIAEPVVRSGSAAGAVIARKSGEEVQFVDLPSWRGVELAQDLLAGDELRTNAAGQLAILFADRTQIRLGRNSTLLVKAIGSAANSEFRLQAGTLWGRAERGGLGLTVETPAAAAAIRGTDWNLAVGDDGRTTLIVLDGVVELFNEFGSVSVAEGEAATAAIGEAPTKIVIVDPDDREQMLFYLSLRGAFTFLPTSPLPSPAMRSERQRIAAIPESARSTDDWLTLAETSLSYDGREAARQALTALQGRPLDTRQQARADYVAAMLAGAEQRYAEADRLLRSALPHLDAERRAVAEFGGYYARALADPSRVEAPPATGAGPYAAIAEALTAGFLDDIPAAIDVLMRAEQRYPDSPTLPAMRAQLARLIDDRTQMREAIDRAFAIDPDDPMALEARAGLKADIESDLSGAIADLERAVAIAPGAGSAWNALGLVLSVRGDMRGAEAAFLRAIALDPEDAAYRANLGILYLDQGRVEDAKREIDRAIAADPSFSIALVARGRYHLQIGEIDRAIDDLLAGTTDNPAYSQGLLLLALAHYEAGNRVPGEQALQNADRLDPNDPVPSSFATVVAIDDYRSADAIDHAQEFLRRERARGGDYSALRANQDAGSTLNNAFRLQGLNAWGQYYGEAVFQPFASSSYVDQAVGGSVNPYANGIVPGMSVIDRAANASSFSSFFQGILLDPLSIAGRSLTPNLIRRPFIEGAIGIGGVTSDGESDWTGQAEVQAMTNLPIPMSLYATLSQSSFPGERPGNAVADAFAVDVETLNGSAYLATQPSPHDRVVLFGTSGRQETDLSAVPNPLIFPFGADASNGSDVRSTNGGAAWSHTFGYRSIGTAALFVNETAGESFDTLIIGTPLGPTGQSFRNTDDQFTAVGALAHAVELGGVTLRYGAEGGRLETETNASVTIVDPILGAPLEVPLGEAQSSFDIGRVYLDAIYDLAPNLTLEGALFGSFIGGDLDEARLEPRIGVAYAPIDGQWLRLGYMREGLQNNIPTLSPVGVVGLQAIQKPLDFDGYSDTIIARWDAEWTPRFFTSLDLQHQELNGLSIAVPASVVSADLAEGRIDRAAFTANLLIGGGLGAFAGIAYADSKNEDPTSPGFRLPLPFVPELAGQVGLTYVHPSNLRMTVAANYVGERQGNPAAPATLDDYWTLDAGLTFEPFDKRLSLEVEAFNLLDEEFEVSGGVPGYGRTLVGRLKVRF